MTPTEPTVTIVQSRSSVELTRGAKGVNPTVKAYLGDQEGLDELAEAAIKTFRLLDEFARKQAE